MLTAQAAGTQVKLFLFTVKHNCSGLDIGQPSSSLCCFEWLTLWPKCTVLPQISHFVAKLLTPFLQMRLFNYSACHSERSEEAVDLSLPLIVTSIHVKQVGLDNRSRIIPQFPDYTKERK